MFTEAQAFVSKGARRPNCGAPGAPARGSSTNSGAPCSSASRRTSRLGRGKPKPARNRLTRGGENHPGGRRIQAVEQPEPVVSSRRIAPDEALLLMVVGARQQRARFVPRSVGMGKHAGRFHEGRDPVFIPGEQAHLASEWQFFPIIRGGRAHQ